MVDFNKLINKQREDKKLIAKSNVIIGGSETGRFINKESNIEEIETEENLDFSLNDFDFLEDTEEVIKPIIASNKSPKETLIIFLKESQLDEEYHIPFNGTYESAKAFIHRMRVELSRFRNQIIKLNKKLNHFHVLTKGIRVESEISCTIVLIKTNNRQRFDAPKIESDVLSFLTIEE